MGDSSDVTCQVGPAWPTGALPGMSGSQAASGSPRGLPPTLGSLACPVRGTPRPPTRPRGLCDPHRVSSSSSCPPCAPGRAVCSPAFSPTGPPPRPSSVTASWAAPGHPRTPPCPPSVQGAGALCFPPCSALPSPGPPVFRESQRLMFKPRPHRPGVWQPDWRWRGRRSPVCEAPWFCPSCGVVLGKHLHPENPTSQPPPRGAVVGGARGCAGTHPGPRPLPGAALSCPHPPEPRVLTGPPHGLPGTSAPSGLRLPRRRPCPPSRPARGPSAPAGIPFPKEAGSRRQTLQNLQRAVGGRFGDGADEPELPAGQGLDLAAGGSLGGRAGACFPGPSRDEGAGGEGKGPTRGCTTGVRPGARRPGCPRAHTLSRQCPGPEPPLVSTATVLGAQRRPSRPRGRGDVAAAREARGVSRLGSRTGEEGPGE